MKKYLLSFAVMLMGTALFTACDDSDDGPNYVPVAVSNGAYVICGGNQSSSINGSLTYIDFATKTAAQNQFAAKNGRTLGLTPNDALVYGEKMYVVVTEENTVEVLNARTLASIRQIKTTELMGNDKGAAPRHITAADGKIYVSTYGSSTADWGTYTTSGNGYVAAIDTTTFALSATYTAGSFPEGLIVAGDYLYVANSDYSMGTKASISAINLATGVDSPFTNSLIVNPQAIAIAGNDVYVLDWGNYYDVLGGIRKISGSTVSTVLDCTTACFMGTNIYGCNASYGAVTTEFSVYNIVSGSKTTLSTGLGDRFFYPNAIGVDPVTGKIYIASYTENESRPGYANYSANGFVAEYSSEGQLENTYACGVGPNAIVFNTGIKYVETNRK